MFKMNFEVPLAAAVAASFCLSASADADFERQVEQRLAALENESNSTTASWNELVSFSGLIEVEAVMKPRW